MTMESLFAKPELGRIRSKFLHVASDFSGEKRLFFDNAGGSLRLARAEQAFAHVDSIPDCSEHSNRVARHLDGFELAGADGACCPADSVEIRGNQIHIKCGQVKRPVNVRFKWINYAGVGLFGTNGIPVAPFRTDSFPKEDK